MVKGLDLNEDFMKFNLFSDLQEMTEASLTQQETELSLIASVLQQKESLTEM